MDELTLGDKTYISSKRAAEITGYAKDYVGQLCREGHVEAKMVGRSWYVLESSIRAHRFGAEEPQVTEEAVEEVIEKESPTIAWETPRYIAEEPKSLPPVLERPAPAPKIDPEEATVAISDMQAAWQEWFERKQDTLPAPEAEPLLESPEVIEERAQEEAGDSPIEEETHENPVSDEEEIAIPVNKVEMPSPEPVIEEEEEVRVPIRTLRTAPAPVVSAARQSGRSSTKTHSRARAGKGSSAVAVALMIAFALVAMGISVIGTGYTDRYGLSNPIVRYLGGTSTVNNQSK